MSRNRFLRQLHARPRLLTAIAVSVLVAIAASHWLGKPWPTGALIAWNAGTCLYFVLPVAMVMQSTHDGIQRRAQLEDAGKYAALALVLVAVIASLVAIAGELGVAKGLHDTASAAQVALATLTVLSSWGLMHLIFALHYAHDFYAAVARNHRPGLLFPGEEKPLYGDFFYFAAIIGTSGQTADVSFVNRPMRRLGTLHCILSFFFNATVLALMINIAASMLGDPQ
jgi:uncharacterized membrane protein